ncbi:MAG: LysR family transcriptional regulator [Marinobacterium sp.]|nr:LysR family transcriptional regulator [Marinobacterium sp.]
MDRLIAAEVFICIVEQGSMAGAANRLDMSRSMVSRYLQQMEDWADARLLHRSTRRLSLTPAGEQVLSHCRTLLQLAAEVPVIDRQQPETPSGKLRITCSQIYAQKVMGPPIQSFLQQYPQVSLDMYISNDAVNMVEQRIDLAIRVTNDLDPNLIARPLGVCRSALVASPDYLQQAGIPATPQALATHNCLTYAYFSSLWQFARGEDTESIAVKGNFSANEAMVLLNGARSGMGISLQPLYVVAPELRKGELVQLLPDWEPIKLGIYAVYRDRRHQSAALRALLDWLVVFFADMEAQDTGAQT